MMEQDKTPEEQSKVEITNLPNRVSMKMTINMLNTFRRMGAHSSRTLSGREFLGGTAQPSKLGCLYPKILVPCCLTLKLIWTSYIILC